jgi:hypothetical protein
MTEFIYLYTWYIVGHMLGKGINNSMSQPISVAILLTPNSMWKGKKGKLSLYLREDDPSVNPG